jgi:hypothetical protein
MGPCFRRDDSWMGMDQHPLIPALRRNERRRRFLDELMGGGRRRHQLSAPTWLSSTAQASAPYLSFHSA